MLCDLASALARPLATPHTHHRFFRKEFKLQQCFPSAYFPLYEKQIQGGLDMEELKTAYTKEDKYSKNIKPTKHNLET